MSLSFWILSISALLIIALIMYKGFENSKGGVLFAPLCRKKADDFVEMSTDVLKDVGENLSKKASMKLREYPHHINVLLHKLWRKISDKVDGYFERLRGHHNIVKKD